MTTALSFKTRRFIIVAVCATIAIFSLSIFSIPYWDDDSVFSWIIICAWLVFGWPIAVAESLYGGGPPVSAALFGIGCILAGFFWAGIVELFSRVWRRYVA